jgi:hypothetical protein
MYTFILNDEQKKSLKVHDSSLYQEAAADQTNLEEVETFNQVAFYLIFVVLFIRFLEKPLRNLC